MIDCSTPLPLYSRDNCLCFVQNCSPCLNLLVLQTCFSFTRLQVDCWTFGKISARGKSCHMRYTLQAENSQEHGLELDAFFEPHIVAWLRDTEVNMTQAWVSRAVGMNSVSYISDDRCSLPQWVPEGANKHSQSVIDLFEFIREAAQVVLHDLPLSEYKRALYLVDLSKVRAGDLYNANFRPYPSRRVNTLPLFPRSSLPILALPNQAHQLVKSRTSSKGRSAGKLPLGWQKDNRR